MAEYIEKEIAIQTIKDNFTCYFPNVIDAVREIPAADVQPVKHGRWIDIYEWAKMHDSTPSGMCIYYWCSECQTKQEKKSNFCPNCGARMDGDAE